jgi:hypothetical protein
MAREFMRVTFQEIESGRFEWKNRTSERVESGTGRGHDPLRQLIPHRETNMRGRKNQDSVCSDIGDPVQMDRASLLAGE